jgi:signal transduction histidine kinase
MIKSEFAEMGVKSRRGVDEWLFEAAARAKARADADEVETPSQIHPLVAAWAKTAETIIDGGSEEPDEKQLHDHRLSTLGLVSCGLAHDLNNMLTIIINNTAIAMMETGQDKPGFQTIREILQAAESAKCLTSRILDFGKNREFMPRPTDTNELITNMLGMMKPVVPKNITKRIMLDPKLQLASADPDHLVHALINLVSNAIDAMPDGGALTITTSASETDSSHANVVPLNNNGYCHIQICDTGTGIQAYDRARVFQPFFTTKPAEKGTGLGLPISKSIIEKHSGRIVICSNQNSGTTVHVYIPFA